MATQGYVIAKSQSTQQYFTSRSSYDRPSWIALDEATVYATAEIAQAAVTKLFKKGSFAATVKPLAELALPMTNLSPIHQDSIPTNNVTAKTHMNVCGTCSHEPCTCDSEGDDTLEVDGQEVTLKQESADEDQICPTCSGSGEGMHDGTRCSSCKGSGVEKHDHEEEDFNEPEDEFDEPAGYVRESGLPTTNDWSGPHDSPADVKASAVKTLGDGAREAIDYIIKHSATGLFWKRINKPVEEAEIKVEPIPVKDPASVADANKDAGTTVADGDAEAKIKVPAAVLSALKQKHAEFVKCSNPDDTHDDTRSSHCMTVAAALQTIIDDLATNTVTGLKMAQVHMTSFMSPISNHIPAIVVKFIAGGGNTLALKDMYDSKWETERRGNN
jgi:hypothetical protein